MLLVPEPENPFDAHALGVWNAAQTQQAGFVPRVVARGLSAHPQYGLVLCEHLDSGERVGLRLLVGQSPLRFVSVKPEPNELRWIAKVVRRSKGLFERADARLTAEPPVDPVEQMRRMWQDMNTRKEDRESDV